MAPYVASAGRVCTTYLIWLALPLLAPSAARAEQPWDRDFHDIQLTCPDPGGGTLELIRANKLGQRDRVRIVYNGASAVKIDVSAAERGKNFETYFTSAMPELESDPDAKEFSDSVLAKFGMMRRGVCLAPQNERDRYFRVIDRQKKHLGAP